MMPRPPRSTLLPFTTLFRSVIVLVPERSAVPCEEPLSVAAVMVPGCSAIPPVVAASASEPAPAVEDPREHQPHLERGCRLLLELKKPDPACLVPSRPVAAPP